MLFHNFVVIFSLLITLLVAWLNRLLGIYLSFFYFAGLYKHKVTFQGCVSYMLNGFVLESVSIRVV